MARWPLLLVPLTAAAHLACSGDKTDSDGDGVADGPYDPNNVTVVTPTQPKGYVAVEVRDGATDRALEGATVRILGAGIEGEAATDAEGIARIGPVNAGAAFSVAITAADRLPATVANLIIDDEAGNFPTLNGALYVGPVGLLEADGELRVQVVSEDGAPLDGASVMAESALAFFVGGVARGNVTRAATTDTDGFARISGLPDVWSLAAHHEALAGLTVIAAPYDGDNDGTADYDGAVLALGGREVRTLALPPVLVLRGAGQAQALQLLASNVPTLLAGGAHPALIGGPSETLRLVFNEPIDRDSILVDLRNEDGSASLPTSEVVSGFDNVLTIDPASDLAAGQEHNLAVRVQSRDKSPTETLQVAGAFFAPDDRASAITVAGRFADSNGNGAWGDGDALHFVVSQPVGRPGAAPAFTVELWVALDLNGSSTVGDAQGELPPAAQPYPAPLLADAGEPSPGNGAALSGYTRYVAPVGINQPVPISQASGAVSYEVRFRPDRNAGRAITTASGREAPATFSASAALVSR